MNTFLSITIDANDRPTVTLDPPEDDEEEGWMRINLSPTLILCGPKDIVLQYVRDMAGQVALASELT